jgi:hypothetical protein
MSVVIKVSKPTYNVLTTGNANLSFSSELATHSIYDIVEADIENPDTSVTITHSLGFIPKVWIFVKLNDGANDYLVRIPNIRDNEYDYHITSSTIVINRAWNTGTDNFYVIIFTRSPNP